MSQAELEQAEELMRKARFPEAIERFRSLLSSDPENPAVRARCGEAYRLTGNNERAFHHYNKAAAIYLRAQDPSSALRMLQFANAVSPNEPEVLFRIAECLKALGETHNMEPILRQIVAVAKGTGDRRRMWALDELAARHPDDLDIWIRRAEALAEAGRIDDAVHAWKKMSAWLDSRGVDFVPMLQRAASIAPDRTDVGVDLAQILLTNHRAREALILLVPFYEKFPDDVGVLDALLRSLEALNATDKITPARIELIKARAKRGIKDGTLREIAVLLQAAPDDVPALEVCAHAYSAFNETQLAIQVWRKLAHLCDRQQKKFERDRAILMLLKANPDDEDALTLGARALREAARNEEAQVLENRLGMIRRMRAKGADGPRSTRSPGTHGSAGRGPDDRPKTSKSTPGIPPASTPILPKKRLSSGATYSLSDSDVISSRAARTPARKPVFAEERTTPPDEIVFVDDEPSLEQMPIAKNPYADDLYLSTGTQTASSGSAVFEDDLYTEESDPGRGFEIEEPESPEETTSRIADLVSDELEELRAQFGDATVRATPALQNMPVHDAPDMDVEGVRATQRLPRLSDLFKELERKKA